MYLLQRDRTGLKFYGNKVPYNDYYDKESNPFRRSAHVGKNLLVEVSFERARSFGESRDVVTPDGPRLSLVWIRGERIVKNKKRDMKGKG